MTITELLTARARRKLSAAHQLEAWLAAHGLTRRDFAASISDASPGVANTSLARLLNGTRAEYDLRERIETATGIPAELWGKRP